MAFNLLAMPSKEQEVDFADFTQAVLTILKTEIHRLHDGEHAFQECLQHTPESH